MANFPSLRRLKALGALAGIVYAQSSLPAATFTWDGGHGGQSRWTDNNNWNPNGAPANDGTADLIFAGTVRLTPETNGDWSINSITFSSTAGAFTLIGENVTLQGTSVTHAIRNDDDQTQTINHALITAANQSWAALAGDLAINGNVTNNHALTLTGPANTTIGGIVAGTGSLIKSGAGTLTLSGANTYSGGTTVSAGTLLGTSASLQGDIVNHAALAFDQAATGTYAGVISGSGAVTKSGAGNLTLSGANTFTGTAAVSAGTLTLSGGSALADTAAVSLADAAGATLALADSETIGSLSGGGSTGGDVSLGANTLTVGSGDYAGAISGSGSLVKDTAGTLALSGANTYFGGTTVSAGTLQGDSASLQGDIVNHAALVFAQASDGTYAGVVSGSGGLVKSGSGNLTLSGANTFTGTATVAEGTLTLGADNAVGASADLDIQTGGTFSLGGDHSVEVAALSFGNATLDFGPTGTANSFLFGSAGTAAGTLTVANWESGSDLLAFNHTLGTPAGSFLESIYFSGIGAGQIGAVNGDWTSIVAVLPTFSVWNGDGANNNFNNNANWVDDIAPGSGATTSIAFDGSTRTGPNLNADYTLNRLKFESTAAAFTLTANAGREFTFDGVVPSIIQASASDQQIVAPIILVKNTFIEISGAGDLTLTGELSGAGGLTTLGTGGELILAGTNTYTGATAITEGTVVLQNAAALGSTAAGTSVSAGATLRLENNISVGAEALALNGSLVQTSGANAYGGAISGSGTVTVDGGTLTLNGASANTYTGATTVNAGTLALAKSSGNAVVGAVVIGPGALRLDAADQIADSSRVSLASDSAVFNLNGHAETIGSLASANSAASVTLGSATLTTGADHTSTTFAGIVSGAGGLAKTGSGTFTLAGANTHTGATTITTGTVILQNSAALGSTAAGTSVASGATLQLENNIIVGAEALALDGALVQTSGANTYGGVISGSGVVTVDGGNLTLNGAAANTYTGVTTVNAGTLVLAKSSGNAVIGEVVLGDGSGTDTLRLDAANQIADTARVILSAGGTPTLNLNGHAETIGSLQSLNTGSVVILGAATLTTGADNTDSTFAGVVSGAGGLAKTGSGTFTLAGANTYSGATTVSAGTLLLGASDRIADTSALNLAGGTLSLGGAFSETVGLLSYNNGVLDFGAAGTGTSFIFAGDGTGTGALVIRNWTVGSDVFASVVDTLDQSFLDNIFFDGIGVGIGAEIFGLTGGNHEIRPIQTFVWQGGNNSGPSPRNAWSRGGNWEGGLAPGIGDGKAIVLAGSTDLASDMNAAYNIHSLLFRDDAGAFDITSSTADTLTVRGGGIYNDSANTQTLGVDLALAANQTWNAASGDLVFSGPTVLLGAHTLGVNGAHDVDISAVVSGAGGIVKNGAGTLTLSAANTYSGATTVSAGTLAISHASALGTDAAGTAVAAGATLSLSGGITVATEALALDGTLLNASGNNGYAGDITFGDGATVRSDAGTLSLTGSLAAGGALTVGGAGDVVIDGTIAGGGDFTKSGDGTVTFNADQTFATLTLGGGTLALGDLVNLTVDALSITAASIIDFGTERSIITVNGSITFIDEGTLLTIANWNEWQDYIHALDGGDYVTGEAPLSQIQFAGWTSPTKWQDYNSEITPVPEPHATGALLLGGVVALALNGRRRFRNRPAARRSA
ncbi:MAG: autotransporter-associated beta strand repeat-containing protein [Verrucomicrobiota bacterium]